MRFGRTLSLNIYRPWKDKYIDYAKLKTLLREEQSAPSSPSTRSEDDEWTEDDESRFVNELVNVQLEKVHSFHRDTYEKLQERTAQCQANLNVIAEPEPSSESSEGSESQDSKASTGNSDSAVKESKNKKAMPSEEEKIRILKETKEELDQITKETNELARYSRINYTGFLKAVKKHDRKRGSSYRVRPLLQVRLAALPFNKEDYDPLLRRLSAMYDFVRQQLEKEPGNNDNKPESQRAKEEYISEKFWVHPENLLEVKTIILRRLPVLVYNPQSSKIAEGSQPDPSITSIYFDNPSFALYTKKIESGEASSLRLRWYGQLEERPDIWVEKKNVIDEGPSTEARFQTKEKNIQRLLNGEYHLEKQIQRLEDRVGKDNEEVQELKSAVDEIQAFIKDNQLQPMLRANYARTAFQVPGDDRVRVSLDTDLAFIREDAIDERPCRDPETWHRTDIDKNEMTYPFSSIRKGEVSRFPFALLEIKLRNNNRKPEWVDDLMNSHLVKRAPKFSKFAHGIAQLFEDYVNTFPFWLSEMETDIRREPLEAFEEEQARKRKEADDDFAVGSLLKSLPGGFDRRRSQAGVVSPVGSPQTTKAGRSPYATTISKPSDGSMGALLVRPTQLEETAEEPDVDETGRQAHGNERSFTPGRLMNLAFSTSKYAQSKRVPLPDGVTKPETWIKDQGPVKVEGKVWLANQRTFIKWQHVSILLASLSLGLFNAAGQHNNVARALAVVYTVVALLTAAWGYGIYMWRVSLIERRSGKDFDAVTGPIVVCIGLIAALVLNFAFKYQAITQGGKNGHHAAPGTNGTFSLAHQGDL